MKLGIRELDAVTFTAAQMEALDAAIRVNDLVVERAMPPATIHLDYDRDQLIDGFRLSRQLWREGCDRHSLDRLLRALGRRDAVDVVDQRYFKEIRARFKHLRFAFVLYSADHRCPPLFKTATTLMGLLQDAFNNQRHRAAARHAALLRLALTRLPRALVNREVDHLVPSDTADFRRFALAGTARLRTMLDREAITAHGFHAARKIVSRKVSFHDDMRTIRPDTGHETMSRYLATINGMMGQFHDDLVRRDTLGQFDYASTQFALPPDIRRLLTALVALYPQGFGVRSSIPSA